MIDSPHKPYQRAVLFSGGGTRYGLYLGMYAALKDLNLSPDLIIATCGGGIAASIINVFPTKEEQKKYIKSDELYQFVKQTKLTEQKSLFKLGLFSLRKILISKKAPFIEDVLSKYLIELSQDIAELPSLKNISFENSNTIIIGSRLLFTKDDIGKPRNAKKLYRKVLFTNNKTARQINKEMIKTTSTNYIESAVDNNMEIFDNFSMTEAMRISVSDMFYVKPYFKENDIYAGGAIDLMPIEIANHLAYEIILEKKQIYKPIEEALVRAVLGFSGNTRLQEVSLSTPTFWIDTQDASQILRKHNLQKSINWLRFEINLKYPRSYQQFQNDMEAQWEYGYQQTIKSIKP